MLQKVFISGKNWKLSLAELISYFKANEIKFEIQFFSKEFFVINFAQELTSTAIDNLGGTIKIADTKAIFPTKILNEAFIEKNKQSLSQAAASIAAAGFADEMAKTTDKVFFGVSVYSAEKKFYTISGAIQRFVGSCVKDTLVSLGKRGRFMGFSKDRRLAQLNQVEVLKKKLIENKAEVLVCAGKDETWVATTVAVHNPFEFQKRDVYKPNQRRIFAMPPRLARMMVNLSGCTPGKTLLDPFCGVGTILQEALLEKAMVVGADSNAWCVKAANQNLEWLTKEYELQNPDFRVVQSDVSKLTQKIGRETVDCIVTEPDLGPALRQVPTGPYALKIIQKLTPLYFGLAEEAHNVLRTKGRLVLVTPYIITRSGQTVGMPVGEKLAKLGFINVQPFTKEIFSGNATGFEGLMGLKSLIEVDEHHKVGREIHVYQK